MRGRPAGCGGVSGAWAAAGTTIPRRPATPAATPIAAGVPTPESGLRADARAHRDSSTRPSPRRLRLASIRRAELHPEPCQDPSPLSRPVDGALLTEEAMRAVRRLASSAGRAAPRRTTQDAGDEDTKRPSQEIDLALGSGVLIAPVTDEEGVLTRSTSTQASG